MTFSVRIGVHDDELDALGHVNQAVYHRYGERSRAGLFRAAGCDFQGLIDQGVGVVLLESTMRYLAELRRADGTVSGELHCTLGLLDLRARRLLADPRERLLAVAGDPALLDGATA